MNSDASYSQLTIEALLLFVRCLAGCLQSKMRKLFTTSALIFLFACAGSLLPAHAEPSSATQLAQAEESTAEPGAVGLVINPFPDGTIRVTNVVPNGPGAKSGVVVGDALIGIEGKTLQEIGYENVMNTLRGAVGTTVNLNMMSPTKGAYTAKITRVDGNTLMSDAQSTKSRKSDEEDDGGNEQVSAATPPRADIGSQNNSGQAAAQSPQGVWQHYGGDESAFTMQYPTNWKVSADPKSGRIEVASPEGASLSILPFFLANTAINQNNAPTLLHLMLQQTAPSNSWSQPQAIGTNAIKSTLSSQAESAAASIVFTPTTAGTAGRFCITRVPRGAQQISADTFAHIMNSLKFAGVPNTGAQNAGSQAGGGIGPITYTQFVDPDQNSFSVEVPAGWTNTGGMVRPIAIDARPWAKTVSPDSTITAFLGDPQIGPCTIPSALNYKLGARQGMTSTTAYGLKTVYLNYQTAPVFLKKYGHMILSKFATDIAEQGIEEYPELARSYNKNCTASSAASMKFTAMYKGVPIVAYFLASTKSLVAYGTGMWWVTLLGGVVTTADRETPGVEVFLHMLRSFQYNPQWSSNAIKAAGDTSNIVTNASNSIFNTISNSYWARQAVQDRAARNFSNYIRGTQDLQDPQTGNVYNVEYGPKYHWIDSGGTVFGTDSTETPGVDWRLMTEVPPLR